MNSSKLNYMFGAFDSNNEDNDKGYIMSKDSRKIDYINHNDINIIIND